MMKTNYDVKNITLPFAIGETIYTINQDDDGKYKVYQHVVGAYLITAGSGYNDFICLSAAGQMTENGFEEFDTFGMGKKIGDWRGQYRSKEKAKEAAKTLNNWVYREA